MRFSQRARRERSGASALRCFGARRGGAAGRLYLAGVSSTFSLATLRLRRAWQRHVAARQPARVVVQVAIELAARARQPPAGRCRSPWRAGGDHARPSPPRRCIPAVPWPAPGASRGPGGWWVRRAAAGWACCRPPAPARAAPSRHRRTGRRLSNTRSPREAEARQVVALLLLDGPLAQFLRQALHMQQRRGCRVQLLQLVLREVAHVQVAGVVAGATDAQAVRAPAASPAWTCPRHCAPAARCGHPDRW